MNIGPVKWGDMYFQKSQRTPVVSIRNDVTPSTTICYGEKLYVLVDALFIAIYTTVPTYAMHIK